MTAALAAAAALALFAAARELAADHGEVLSRSLRRLRSRRPVRGDGRTGNRARTADRIRRAGLQPGLTPALVAAIRVAMAATALPLALALAPVAPGRASLLIAVGLPFAAALAPDAWLDRRARERAREIDLATPDALELMAVGAASGRGTAALLARAADADRGPLADELRVALAEIETGRPLRAVLRRLGRETGSELSSVAILLERSHRLGSPLADALRERAAAMREESARSRGERAARAAPKIQLAVALLLVPSVLLILAAAILANADALLAGL